MLATKSLEIAVPTCAGSSDFRKFEVSLSLSDSFDSIVFKPDHLRAKSARTGDEPILHHPLVANEISATIGFGNDDAPNFEFGRGDVLN
jgi:hypothetical protein